MGGAHHSTPHHTTPHHTTLTTRLRTAQHHLQTRHCTMHGRAETTFLVQRGAISRVRQITISWKATPEGTPSVTHFSCSAGNYYHGDGCHSTSAQRTSSSGETHRKKEAVAKCLHLGDQGTKVSIAGQTVGGNSEHGNSHNGKLGRGCGGEWSRDNGSAIVGTGVSFRARPVKVRGAEYEPQV